MQLSRAKQRQVPRTNRDDERPLARCGAFAYRLATLRFGGFAACSGPPSHCRPSAQDKASWRGQTSTLVVVRHNLRGRSSPRFSKREVSQKLSKCFRFASKSGPRRSIHPPGQRQRRQIDRLTSVDRRAQLGDGANKDRTRVTSPLAVAQPRAEITIDCAISSKKRSNRGRSSSAGAGEPSDISGIAR